MDSSQSILTTALHTDPNGYEIKFAEQIIPREKLFLRCRVCETEKLREEFYYAPKIDRNRSVCKQCKSNESNQRIQLKKRKLNNILST